MHSTDLTTAQADALTRGLYPGLHYLARLNRRTERVLLPGDPLRQLVSEAYDAMRALSAHVHRLSCRPGSCYNRKPTR